MKTVLKTLIDYSLFEKYGKEYFINNRILPLYENDMSIKFAVCKSSELENIKDAYQVNIQNTLIDFEKKQINLQQTNEILDLAQEIINKNWISYKNQTKADNREFLSTYIKLFIIKEENYYENEALRNTIMENINNKMQLINQMPQI